MWDSLDPAGTPDTRDRDARRVPLDLEPRLGALWGLRGAGAVSLVLLCGRTISYWECLVLGCDNKNILGLSNCMLRLSQLFFTLVVVPCCIVIY